MLPRSICHQEFADDIIIDTSHPDSHVVIAKLSEGMHHLPSQLVGRQGSTPVSKAKRR